MATPTGVCTTHIFRSPFFVSLCCRSFVISQPPFLIFTQCVGGSRGFCARRLLDEFGYVWLTILLINTFISSSQALVMSHPRVAALIEAIKARAAKLKESFMPASEDAEAQEEPDMSMYEVRD